MSDYPLISAIMIIKDDVSLSKLEFVIRCFESQTYPHKELVIVNNAKSQDAASKVEIKSRKDVFIVDTPIHLTAGHARNYGIQHANGPIIAQFDYDCYHHPKRLESQLSTMINNNAKISVLSKCYKLYNQQITHMTNNANAILNTMMFIRPKSIDYPETNKGEELVMLEKLLISGYHIISLDDISLVCKILDKFDDTTVNTLIKNIQ